MSPSESEDDTKKTGPQPEPICLFYFPNPLHEEQAEEAGDVRRTYVEAEHQEDPRVEFLRKLQHSTPRRTEGGPLRKSPARRRVQEAAPSTTTSEEAKREDRVEESRTTSRRQKTGRDSFRPRPENGGKRKDDVWLRRRTGSQMKRKPSEPAKNLKSYLLNTVHEEKTSKKALPSLVDVFNTIKDAWPPNRTFSFDRVQDKPIVPPAALRGMRVEEAKSMQVSQPLLNRRFSMPEEVMRKYSVTRGRTSEESETNKTMPEATSPSSKEPEEGTEDARRPRRKNALRSEVFSKRVEEEDANLTRHRPKERSFVVLPEEAKRRKKEEQEEELLKLIQTSDSEEPNVLPPLSEPQAGKKSAARRGSAVELPVLPEATDGRTKRVTQYDFYNQGKGIIRVKAVERGSQTGNCTCRSEKVSSTTASAKEESEEAGTSESLSSRSPTTLPHREDESSDNLSSESDYIACTCAELTSSKETSSDMFHSGKSTLSQTVSDKSVSTQDSTVSINSVSTRGSTISADSASTSPELDPKTSAKETTTSPDHTPRTPRSKGRSSRGGRVGDPGYGHLQGLPDASHEKSCPRYTVAKGTKSTLGPRDTEQDPRGQKKLEDLYNIPDRNKPSADHEKSCPQYQARETRDARVKSEPRQKEDRKQRQKSKTVEEDSDDSDRYAGTTSEMANRHREKGKEPHRTPSKKRQDKLPKPESLESSFAQSSPKTPEDLYNLPDRNRSVEEHEWTCPKYSSEQTYYTSTVYEQNHDSEVNDAPDRRDKHHSDKSQDKSNPDRSHDRKNNPDKKIPDKKNPDRNNLDKRNHDRSNPDRKHDRNQGGNNPDRPHQDRNNPDRSQDSNQNTNNPDGNQDGNNREVRHQDRHNSERNQVDGNNSAWGDSNKRGHSRLDPEGPQGDQNPTNRYNVEDTRTRRRWNIKGREQVEVQGNPRDERQVNEAPKAEGPKLVDKRRESRPDRPEGPMFTGPNCPTKKCRDGADMTSQPEAKLGIDKPQQNPTGRNVKFQTRCSDKINCSTPIAEEHEVPEIDVSYDDATTMTPKNSDTTEEQGDCSTTLTNSERAQPEMKMQDCEGAKIPSQKEAKREVPSEPTDPEMSNKDVGSQECYKWAKLTEEEMYMMQQQRHRKFIENQRQFSIPLSAGPDTGSLSACAANGSAYKEAEEQVEAENLMMIIPRYSALPRTLSMVVNTSSGDTSIHSDSDNQSLADSLEDHPTTHVHKMYFDTKQEAKPVRGDASAFPGPETQIKHRQPRGRAFFVSIKDPYGEDQLLDIDRIPEPPDKIKNQIFERHLQMCKKHTQNIEVEKRRNERYLSEVDKKKSEKLKKTEAKVSPQKTTRVEKKERRVESKQEEKVSEIKEKTEQPEEKSQTTQTQQGKQKRVPEGEAGKATKNSKRKTRESKGRSNSKIPVPVQNRSTSSSAERESHRREDRNARRGNKKPPRMKSKKERVKREAGGESLSTPKPKAKEAKLTGQKTLARTALAKISGESKLERIREAFEPAKTNYDSGLSKGSSNTHKPQAVIHPSQMPLPDPVEPPQQPQQRRLSVISSLDPTTTILQLQPVQLPQLPSRQWSKPVPVTQSKRSPVMKFHQRFEVIPEERSSSLTSSAEERWSSEKNRRASLPVKLAETKTNSVFPEVAARVQEENKKPEKRARRYSLGSVSNLIIAQLMGRPLQAIPCIQRGPNNESQQIIVLSPKEGLESNPNSSKGRDALVAMNRDDFNRLSQGWMNFYLLKENSDSSDSNPEDEGGGGECRNGHGEKPKTYRLQSLIDVADIALTVSKSGKKIKDKSEENRKQKVERKEDENSSEESENTIICKVQAGDKDAGTSDDECNSLGHFSPQKTLRKKNNNQSGSKNKGAPESYSMFIKNQEELGSCGEVKTSEFVLIEKSDNHELMCVNGKECTDSNNCQRPIQDTKKEKILRRELAAMLAEMKKLDENVRFHCSNTILQTTKPIQLSPRTMSARAKRQSSLPEVKTPAQRSLTIQKASSSVDVLPKVSGKPSDQDGMDSDSTVYFQPPSPRVPPLPLDGSGEFMSDGSYSSSSSGTDSEGKAPIATLPIRYLPLRKRGVSNRARHKRDSCCESPHIVKPGSSGWTVTVAGTVELSRSVPDIEMRLSFPVNARPPPASQSDSGFAEDANSSQNLDHPRMRRQAAAILPPANIKQRWIVTVKNPGQGGAQEGNKAKLSKKNYQLLPELGQSQYNQNRNTKRVLKLDSIQSREEMENKLFAVWPKVREMIEKKLMSHDSRIPEVSSVYQDETLSVRGCAVPFEVKPKVQKMTQRDVTGMYTARSVNTIAQPLAAEGQ